MNIIGKALKLFQSKTPRLGKKIRNVGLALLGAGAAPVAMEHAGALPEIPESWIFFLDAIKSILLAVGTLMTIGGQAQTDELLIDEDE